VDFDELCAHLTHLIIFSIEVSPEGKPVALDRVPPAAALERLTSAATQYGTKVQISFGGNGRTQGFPQMTTDRVVRRQFIARLITLVARIGFHGVDYNWEYPRDEREWKALLKLIRDTRAAFDAAGHPDWVISAAYYPDGQQEAILAHCPEASFFHSMAYDARGKHSTMQLAKQVVLYSRHIQTGEWQSYRSLVEAHGDAVLEGDLVQDKYFNGVATIQRKVRLARKRGLAGVMIWEAGLDVPTTDRRSLLRAIRDAATSVPSTAPLPDEL
jgi:chitinase